MKNEISNRFRVPLNLRQRESKIMGTWDVQSLLNELFSMYYKNIILSDIASLLFINVDPKNIVIFNDEINPNWIMSKMNSMGYDINSEIPLDNDGISFLYEFGLPYGLLPSKEISSLRYIEEVYRTLESFVWYHTKDHSFKGRKLYAAMNIYKLEGVEKAIEHLKNAALDLCKNEDRSKIQNKMNNELRRYYDDYLSITTNDIDKINSMIISDNKLSVEKIKNLYGNGKYIKYGYNKFYELFVNYKIPLIAVYSPENRTFKFCSFYIFSKIDNPYFFDLREYSHKSPSIVEIVGIISSIITIYQFFSAYINKKRVESKRPEITDLIDFSIEISDDDKVNIMELYDELKEQHAIKNIISKEILNNFIKSRINNMYNECIEDFSQQMKNFNMEIDYSKRIKIYSIK